MSIIKNILGSFFGSKSDRDLKVLKPVVEKVQKVIPAIELLSDDQLRGKTYEFQTKLKEAVSDEDAEIVKIQAALDKDEVVVTDKEASYKRMDELHVKVHEKSEEVLKDILPEAFAVVKETARRLVKNKQLKVTAQDFDKDLASKFDFVSIEGDQAIWANHWLASGAEQVWNMIHYDVQLIGGSVLHDGKVAEMQTGEGKTLVATLPVYLNALSGKGVHVVTVNDYLAKRDSEWMGPLYQFHGLSVDCIDKYQPNSEERRAAYLKDITFGTNNEFGFDYLRDNMARSPEDLVQRQHNYAIVDEVESVLIDDARTPLIISGPVPKGDEHEFTQLKPQIQLLYDTQKKLVTFELSEAKKLFSEGSSDEAGKKLLRAYRGLPKNNAMIKFLAEEGTKILLQKTENHFMQDQSKEMFIIDDDLYFTIDEKNNSIELTDKGIDLISKNVSEENFYILPDVGTELALLEEKTKAGEDVIEEREVLMRDFAVKSERIHTMNQLLKAYALFEKEVDYVVMDNKVKIVDEQTGRIMEGRRYSDGLHQAIEAKENVKIEAATQTHATVTLQNYFRMYNKLSGMTGTAETEAGELWDIYELDVIVIPTNRPISRIDHEDKVFKTQREKFNAVVEEVVGLSKSGRPVLVGTTSVDISEKLSRILQIRGVDHSVLNAKKHQQEANIVAEAGKPGKVTIATNMAGRGTDIKLSDEAKAAGGLAIVGTERHDSRRVDRQLRGRAGRQGDVGSSQFLVSLDDKLMRLFGSERIAKLMDRMGLEEGEVIQHSMISKSIERAQKKVEENNFGVRKRLLEYDDVMNSQREVVYKRRRHALDGERLSVDITNMCYDTCQMLVDIHSEIKDFEAFKFDVLKTFSMDCPFDEDVFSTRKSEDLIQALYEESINSYSLKMNRIAQSAFQVVKDVYEDESVSYENIVVPFTDGNKVMQVVTNLEEAYKTEGKSLINSFEKNVTLAIIDEAWKEHLREMDDLKQSVQNAVYEQKDPLLIYKFESFNLFKVMLEKLNSDITSFLYKANLPIKDSKGVQRARVPQSSASGLTASRNELPRYASSSSTQKSARKQNQQVKTQPVRTEAKVGRNDPCPCGSGKKYKKCHG
jgi:preprotein translocase subunit SecA